MEFTEEKGKVSVILECNIDVNFFFTLYVHTEHVFSKQCGYLWGFQIYCQSLLQVFNPSISDPMIRGTFIKTEQAVQMLCLDHTEL